VNDEIEALRTEERFEGYAVPDVDIMVCEASGDCAEPVEIPGGVAGITKKDLAHIIVDAVDLTAQAVEMFHCFRANEPAGTGNQNCLWLHLSGLILPIEVGRAINIMRQIPRICIHGHAGAKSMIGNAKTLFSRRRPGNCVDAGSVGDQGFELGGVEGQGMPICCVLQ